MFPSLGAFAVEASIEHEAAVGAALQGDAFGRHLNDNLVDDVDSGFAQQDGAPLLNKKWARSVFGEESFVSILAYTEAAGSSLFVSEVLRDLARLERQTLETTLIPWRNYGFKQYSLDGDLGFFDFCARSCP